MMSDLEMFARLCDQLQAAHSDKQKLLILKRVLAVKLYLDRYLHAACSPLRKYHLTSADALSMKRYVKPQLRFYGTRNVLELLYVFEHQWWPKKKAACEWCAFVLKQPQPLRKALNIILDQSFPCDLDVVNRALAEAKRPLIV